MTADPTDVVRQAYDAFRRRDVPATFALLDPDVEVYQTDLVPWGGTYRGHEGAREFFGKLLGHIESTVEVERMHAAGEHVAVVARTRGTVRATGAQFDVPVVHIWRVRDGRVAGFSVYLDTPLMLRALGEQAGAS